MAEPITSGHLAALTSPAATPELVEHLAQTVLDQRTHDHPSEGKGEDFYCMNLTSYMGERMGPVLVRLREAEAEIVRLRAELKTYKAPPDFHNADHMARVRQVVTDTIREFGTDPERAANGVMLSFEAAMHSAEREAARAMDLAEATLTSLETANAEVARLRAEVDQLRQAVTVLKGALRHDLETSGCRERPAYQAGLKPCQQRPAEYDDPCETCVALETVAGLTGQ